jgi:DNA-binding PadR family transcriptional regulator
MTDERNYLGGLEEIVLLAVQHLGDNAYGASIHRALEEAGRHISIGSLYITLARIEDKGYLKSKLGEATPERGGKVKKYFILTGKGERALEASEYGRHYLRLQSAYPEGLT